MSMHPLSTLSLDSHCCYFRLNGSVVDGNAFNSPGTIVQQRFHSFEMLPFHSVQYAQLTAIEKRCLRNGVSVEGATHKQVVDLIKSGGDCLTLTVISVTQQEADRLEPQEDQSGYSYIDYSDKRSLPISIPDYGIVNRNGERYIVFNIHMAGRQLCSRRYREFANLHSLLRKEFSGFNFPKLPGKWPFQLSEQQLDTRRRGLEQYLEKVCAVRVIAESDAVQDFLTDTEDDISASPVDIKVMLPDHEVSTVSVKKSSNAQVVWEILVQRANLTAYTQQYFYLFEIVEYNFERKLQPHEIPHQLYVQNYSTASSTCLCVRRWLFSVAKELTLPDGEQAGRFIFYQAVDEVNRGNIRADGRLYELKALQDAKKAGDYLALARTLPGYGDVVFPHCSCDSRKEGHVVPAVGIKSFRLHACREDGSLEAQMVELTWDSITRSESDEESMSFCFQYNRPDKPARWVKVYTPYHAFLADCFDRIMEERKWEDSGD
ncbi:sorting nexin-27 isoform X3 [Drosophila erecta]|nr:sorting nexin-27 isoform X3 [Drosophila erecta]